MTIEAGWEVQAQTQENKSTDSEFPSNSGQYNNTTSAARPFSILMACHPSAQVTTCKDRLDIHHSTEYEVTDASSQHHGKD